ncbi:MAG: D-2-hydroxyacid dehydrogenase, partial [Actinobacteria bacterium]|nr:D-2-hydroxyacid dehydrogenase [Actinomycetota bacterium]
ALEGAEIVFAWDYEEDLLPSAWSGAGSVRWIQAASAGVDALLFPELIEGDVLVTNARGVFDEPMAEYVLGLVLAFAKDFPTTFEHRLASAWEHRDTERLAGMSLLVVGVGPVGRAVARLGRAVGMEVEGLGRTARAGDGDFGVVLGAGDLHGALAWSDYVVNALPSTPGTRHLFDAAAFACMKPTARFVNVGRGATVDERALADALRAGTIAGAALDVFEEEPLPAGSPLWRMPNVIVSPHMSGDFAGWERAVVEVFVDNLGRWVRGEPLRNVVDKRLGYVRDA